MTKIRLVPYQTIGSTSFQGAREFVALTKLFSAFELDEFATIDAKAMLSTGGIFSVEKRNEHELLLLLEKHCLKTTRAELSPIVTKDGWVYWCKSGAHRSVLEGLSILYSKGEDNSTDFLLRNGVIWQVSTMRPNVIEVGKEFVTTKEDRKLFELFEVNVIEHW